MPHVELFGTLDDFFELFACLIKVADVCVVQQLISIDGYLPPKVLAEFRNARQRLEIDCVRQRRGIEAAVRSLNAWSERSCSTTWLVKSLLEGR